MLCTGFWIKVYTKLALQRDGDPRFYRDCTAPERPCLKVQETPETFNIESEDRPRRRRVNTLRKEQETGSSGYRRVPPEPLEMQAKEDKPNESD